jgi:hypothetical protein
MPDIEELKKLSPEERIKKLKEIEENRKKEIEEAETLISESMRELDDEQEKKEIPIPQLKADDISSLLTVEEKRMFATKRFVNVGNETASAPGAQRNLEEVTEASPPARQASSAPIYGQALERARSENNPMEIYNRNTSVTTGKSEEVHPYESGSVTGTKYHKHEEKKSEY